MSGFIVHVAALLFLWLKPASTVLRACLVARAYRFFIQWLRNRHVKNTSRPEPVVCDCSAISQAPLKVSGQTLQVKAPTSSSILLWASLSECARASLLVVIVVWFQEIIVAAEKIVAREDVWVDSKSLRIARSRDTRTTYHSSLEMEASLGVQELLETEDLGAYGLTSNTLLQWAALTEFPCVVGLFELNCWAFPLAAFPLAAVPLAAVWALRRSVRSCTSLRFLRSEFHQDFCRT